MKPILYRVETYIVPEMNEEQGFSLQNAINDIDDLKIANRLKREDEDVSENNTQNRKNTSNASHNKCMESKRYSVENNNLITRKMKDITNETLSYRQFDNNNVKYNDQNSDEHLYVQREFQSSIGSQDTLYPVRQFKKVNSLMSIDERSEISLESKVSDFCHHGFKNGCTATIPSPEEVSDEIFKENWLQKMEILRQRDAALKEREMDLQRRERDLFRREKELRITERILNDKLKLVDQQLKYQKDVQLVEKKLGEAARILSHEFKEPEESIKTEMRDYQPPEKTLTSTPEKIINPCEKNEETDTKIKCPTRPKNYPSKQTTPSNTISGIRSYASIRYKERPPRNKIHYDDLNSTLSADIGDSSFVRTSELFNPLLYKKPYAFTRSASERWTSKTSNTVITRPQVVVNVEEKSEPIIEEDKVLRKLSENIVASQDKNTRFQNYGLVDCISDDIQSSAKHNPGSEKKLSSYLDLATGDKHGRQKRTNVSKDRPISWNEKEDEWLQKKRQAYNLAIKNSAESKENLKCNIVAEKGGKSSKKDVKSKLFTIFR
ncbi:unnamed protein product [Lasius platythorax]|uniref:Uncharacterized protein n=1 Tax=Lasius platythorax TaxID=488582 RepID=A0AAV2P3D0_9HYME